jgi:hypothetical protein
MTMQYTLAIVDPGRSSTDVSNRARNARVDGVRLAFDIPMDVLEASQYVDDSRIRLVTLARWGKVALFRLMTPKLIDDGVAFEAILLIAALEDDEYAAVWSDTLTSHWSVLTKDVLANRREDRYEMDTNNRVYISARKNEQFYNVSASDGTSGSQVLPIPADSSRKWLVLQCDYEYKTSDTTWRCSLQRFNSAWGNLGDALTLVGSTTVVRGAFCAAFAATEYLVATMLYNTATPTLFIGETGDCYFKLTNVRAATSTTNMVNTTVTSGAIAIGAATVSVSTAAGTNAANLHVGQRVVINSGAADSESVVLTAVGVGTITATFTKAHLAGATVRAIVVYDQEIVSDILSQVTTLNPASGMKSSTALIRSSGRDLLDKAWSAASPISVISELAAPADYAYGVTEDAYLYYWPKGTNAREWSVRAADIELSRPVESTRNSIRVMYENAAGVPQVTAYATDAPSVAANGITRRRTISAQTSSATEAALIRDTALADQKKRATQSSVSFRKLYDRAGVEYPPGLIRPGDTITITNLPAILSTFSLRTFTVADVAEDLETGQVSVTPEEPLPRLDVLFARLAL